MAKDQSLAKRVLDDVRYAVGDDADRVKRILKYAQGIDIEARRESEEEQYERILSREAPCSECGEMVRQDRMYDKNARQFTPVPVEYETCAGRVMWPGQVRICRECALGIIEDNTFECARCGELFVRVQREWERESSSLMYDHCDECYKLRLRESKIVNYNNRRTQELGLVSDLTIDEWIEVLDAHGWACAYCGGEYEALDHVTPVSKGGGTTKDNVVPSCAKCNASKGDRVISSRQLSFFDLMSV
jgi:5-methylcytosine-specific restriction endonuclease McrA